MDPLPFVPRWFTFETALALAKKLTSIASGNLDKVIFTKGGLEAIEAALKIVR